MLVVILLFLRINVAYRIVDYMSLNGPIAIHLRCKLQSKNAEFSCIRGKVWPGDQVPHTN